MHDNLWAGANLRVEAARSSLDQIAGVFQPPARTREIAAQAAAVAISRGVDWQSRFYELVARFLAQVRSVPWIVEACFGEDRRSSKMKNWWDSLPADEQRRREAFSRQFRSERRAIDDHPLTTERDISEHRSGIPAIEGKVVGPFGRVHIATPTNRIPDAECWPSDQNIGADPALQWAATLPARPLEPRLDQFTIMRAKKPLFAECKAYIVLAEQIVAKANVISRNVHGANALTAPPAS